MKKFSIFALSLALLGCDENQNSSQNNTNTQPRSAAASFSSRSFSQLQTCQYNFDATQQDYDDLWNNQYSDYLIGVFPTINGQKFSLTVSPPYFSITDPEYGTFNYLQYLAASKSRLQTSGDDEGFLPPFLDRSGDLPLPHTGILALEMQLDIPAAPLNGGYYGEPSSSYLADINFSGTTENGYVVRSGYSFMAGTADPDFGENPPSLFFSLSSQHIDGTDYKSIVSFNSKMAEYKDKQHRLGVYINQNTKQVGFIVNGVDQGYQGTLPAPLKNIGFDIFNVINSDKDGTFSDKLAGLAFSSELITDRNALQFNYPQGTTDICGNVI
jgi:hypothetical protein